MKLWIDDLREPPDATWVWFKDSASALRRLAIKHDDLYEISFDHDLGGDDTSIKVANEIERLVYLGHMDMPDWYVHSANPVGRANIARVMQSAERFAAIWQTDDPLSHLVDGSHARDCTDEDEGHHLPEGDHRDRPDARG